LGRFDDAPHDAIELRFVGGANALRLGLGDEIVQPVSPQRLIQR
jgi:hypothetical protein